MLEVLIVDDERLARAELRRLLDAHDDVTVVGEAATADAAESALAAERPDLLLLDVQMPGADGFDLLRRLDAVPEVVFATAYDEYAIDAFEVSALDYLVKPIDPDRLADTLDRVRHRLASAHGASDSDPDGASDDASGDASTDGSPERLTPNDQVFVKDGDRYFLVRLKDVRLFESEGNYTRIYFDDGQPLVHRSLSYLEERLDPASFFRANRQYILNLAWVDDLEPWLGDRIIAKVDGAPDVEMSRRRSRTFRERMKL